MTYYFRPGGSEPRLANLDVAVSKIRAKCPDCAGPTEGGRNPRGRTLPPAPVAIDPNHLRTRNRKDELRRRISFRREAIRQV